MRLTLCAAFVALPLPALAETFVIPSMATEALVYPSMASVLHAVSVDIPAGSHELIFPDLPEGLDMDSLRIAAPGLKIGAARLRRDFVPPINSEDTPEVIAAKDRIRGIETQIQTQQDLVTERDIEIAAAQDQITFLSSLGSNENLGADVSTLRDTSRMVGEEILAARKAILGSEIAKRKFAEVISDLKDDLKQAQAALNALVPEPEDRPFVSISVTAAEQTNQTPIELTFITDAAWYPSYDLRLNDRPSPTLTVERFAQIAQGSGENWAGINLTLSSQNPDLALSPSVLRPNRKRLFDPEELQAQQRKTRTLLQADRAESGAMVAPAFVEDATGTTSLSASGLEVSYAFSAPVDIASGADTLRIPFDSLEFPVDLVARAVPLFDDTAYLVARFTNSSTEPLLQSYGAQRFFEGRLVGNKEFPEIAAGAEAELGFGVIRGLKLNRTILKRAEGDRGIISKSNEQTEQVRIEVENLTDRTWDVELRDRVPFSEQEDLVITYSADPEPDIRAVDRQRGILQWNIEMVPGNSATIETSWKMTWPDGQIVR